MKKVKTLVMNNLDFNQKEELEVYKSMRKNLKNSFLKKVKVLEKMKSSCTRNGIGMLKENIRNVKKVT